MKKIVKKSNKLSKKSNLGLLLFSSVIAAMSFSNSTNFLGKSKKVNLNKDLKNNKPSKLLENNQKAKLIDLFQNEKIANGVLKALNQQGILSDTSLSFNTEVSLEQLEKIEEFDFSDLYLSNFNSILNNENNIVWKNLKKLNLSNNDFSNLDLKIEVKQFPQLEELKISNSKLNQVADLSSFADSTKNFFKVLDFSNNNINSIPDYFSQLTFGSLNLSNNQISGISNSELLNIFKQQQGVFFNSFKPTFTLNFDSYKSPKSSKQIKPFYDLSENNFLNLPVLNSLNNDNFQSSSKLEQSEVLENLFLDLKTFKKFLRVNSKDLSAYDLLKVNTDATEKTLTFNNKNYIDKDTSLNNLSVPSSFTLTLKNNNKTLVLNVFQNLESEIKNKTIDISQNKVLKDQLKDLSLNKVFVDGFTKTFAFKNFENLFQNLTSYDLQYLKSLKESDLTISYNYKTSSVDLIFNNRDVKIKIVGFDSNNLEFKQENKVVNVLEAMNQNNYVELKVSKQLVNLAKTFGLNVLGKNLLANQFKLLSGDLTEKNVDVLSYNEQEGYIILTFNLNNLKLADESVVANNLTKNLTVKIYGFEASNLAFLGDINTSKFANLAFERSNIKSDKKVLFDSLIKKTASQITAEDLLEINLFESNRSDLKNVNKNNINEYLTLESDDQNGLIKWTLKTQGNLENGLKPLNVSGSLSGFKKTLLPTVSKKSKLKTVRSRHYAQGAPGANIVPVRKTNSKIYASELFWPSRATNLLKLNDGADRISEEASGLILQDLKWGNDTFNTSSADWPLWSYQILRAFAYDDVGTLGVNWRFINNRYKKSEEILKGLSEGYEVHSNVKIHGYLTFERDAADSNVIFTVKPGYTNLPLEKDVNHRSFSHYVNQQLVGFRATVLGATSTAIIKKVEPIIGTGSVKVTYIQRIKTPSNNPTILSKTFDTAEKVAYVSGFRTENLTREAISSIATFTKKPAATSDTLPSAVSKGNWEDYLTASAPDNLRTFVTSAVADDDTGQLTLKYFLYKQEQGDQAEYGYASEEKTAVIDSWYTTQRLYDETDVVFGYTPLVKTTAPSAFKTKVEENPAKLTDYLTPLNLPAGAELSELTVTEPNDIDGTVDISYKLTRPATNGKPVVTSATAKGISLIGFLSSTDAVNKINPTITARTNKNTVLPSEITPANYRNYIDVTLPQGVTLENATFYPNDTTGDLKIRYRIKENGIYSDGKEATLSGFRTAEVSIESVNPNIAVNSPWSETWFPSKLGKTEPNGYSINELSNLKFIDNLPVPEISLNSPTATWNADPEVASNSEDVIVRFANWTEKDWKKLFAYLFKNKETKPEIYNKWLDKIADQVNAALDAKKVSDQSTVDWGSRIWTINFEPFKQGANIFKIGGYSPSAGSIGEINANEVMDYSSKIKSKEGFKKGIERNLAQFSAELENIDLSDTTNPYLDYIRITNLPKGYELQNVSFTDANDGAGTVKMLYKVFKPATGELSSTKEISLSGFLTWKKYLDTNNLDWSATSDIKANSKPSDITTTNYKDYLVAASAANNSGNEIKEAILNNWTRFNFKEGESITDLAFSSNDGNGTLNISYKLAKVVDGTTYKSDLKTTSITGFLTTNAYNQKLVNEGTATFTKKSTVAANMKASAVQTPGASSNYASSIEETKPAGTTVNVISLTPDDNLGVLNIQYKLAISSTVSATPKTASVFGWYKTSDELNLAATIATNDQAPTVLPSSIRPDSVNVGEFNKSNLFKYVTVSGLPDGYSIDIEGINSPNDTAGTLQVVYRVKKDSDPVIKAPTTKTADLTGFGTLSSILSTTLNSVTATASTSGATKLPTAANLPNNNLDNFAFNVAEGYEVVPNFVNVSNFNADNGTVSVEIKVRKQGTTSPESATRTINNVTGFKTKTKELEDASANFTLNPTEAAKLTPNEVNPRNLLPLITATEYSNSNFPYKHEITRVEPDPTDPTAINVFYKMIIPGTPDTVSEEKAVKLTGFKAAPDNSAEVARIEALNVRFTKKDPANDIYSSSLIQPDFPSLPLGTPAWLFPTTAENLPTPQVFKNQITDYNSRKIKLLAAYFPGWTEQDWKNLFSYLSDNRGEISKWMNAIANKLNSVIETGKDLSWFNTVIFRSSANEASDFANNVQRDEQYIRTRRSLGVLGALFYEAETRDLIDFGGITQNDIVKKNTTFITSASEPLNKSLLRNFAQFRSEIIPVNENSAAFTKKLSDVNNENVLLALNVTGITASDQVKVQILKTETNDVTGDLKIYYQLVSTKPGVNARSVFVKTATIPKFLKYQLDVDNQTASFSPTIKTNTIKPSEFVAKLSDSNITDYYSRRSSSAVYGPTEVVYVRATSNDAAGTVSLVYKIKMVVGADSSYETTERTTTLTGFKTSAQQEIIDLNNASATFAKTATVTYNEMASVVTTGQNGNFSSKITSTPSIAQATVNITSLNANDNTGILTINYTLSKNGHTSTPKVGYVTDWWTNQNKIDAMSVDFTAKAGAETVLASSVSPSIDTYIQNNASTLPSGYSVRDVAIASTNDLAGNLIVKYNITGPNNYVSGEKRSDPVTGFKTSQTVINNPDFKATLAPKDARANVLPSSVNSNNYSDYLNFEVPEGYEVVNLTFSPDDKTGNLNVSYQLKEKATNLTSSPKNETVSGFNTLQNTLNAHSLNFAKSITALASDMASNVIAPNDPGNNFYSKVSVTNTIPVIDRVEIVSLLSDDTTGDLTIRYKLHSGDTASNVKEAQVSGWKTIQQVLNEPTAKAEFTNKATAITTLPSQVTSDNWNDYLFVSSTLGANVVDVTIENVDDSAGTFSIKYKLEKSSVKSSDFKTSRITDFKNTQQAQAADLKNALNTATVVPTAVGSAKLPSTISPNNTDLNFTLTAGYEVDYSTVSLANSNNELGTVDISFKVKKTGTANLSEQRTIKNVGGFLTRQKDVDNATLPISLKEGKAELLASVVNKTNINEHLNIGAITNSQQEATNLKYEIVLVNPNLQAGSVDVYYKIISKKPSQAFTDSGLVDSTTNKKVTVAGFKTLQSFLNEKEATFTNINPIATQTLPSSVNSGNYTRYLNQVLPANDISIVDINMSDVDDGNGTFTLKYKLKADGLVSDQKSVNITSFKNLSETLNALSATFTGLTKRAEVAPQEVNKTNWVNYIELTSVPTGYKLSLDDLEFEVNTQNNSLVIKYKLVKMGTNIKSDQKSAPAIDGWLSQNDFQKKYVDSAQATFTKTATVPADAKASQVSNSGANPNYATWISQTVEGDGTVSDVRLSANDSTGVLTITYKITRAGVSSDDKTALISNWHTNLQVANAAVINFENKESAATTLPSEVNAANFTDSQTISGLPEGYNLTNLRFSAVENNAGTFTLTYQITNGSIASEDKTHNFSAYQNQASRDSANLVAALNSVTAQASEAGTNKYPNTLTSSDAAAFSFNMNPGYELGELVSVANPSNENGTIDVTLKVKKTGTTTLSEQKTLTGVSGFLTYNKDVEKATQPFTPKENVDLSTLLPNVINPDNFTNYLTNNTWQNTTTPAASLALDSAISFFANIEAGTLTIKYRVDLFDSNTPPNSLAKSVVKTTVLTGFKTKAQAETDTTAALNALEVQFTKKEPLHDVYGSKLVDVNYLNQPTNYDGQAANATKLNSINNDNIINALTVTGLTQDNNARVEINLFNSNDVTGEISFSYRLVSTINGLNAYSNVKQANNITGFLTYNRDLTNGKVTIAPKPTTKQVLASTINNNNLNDYVYISSINNTVLTEVNFEVIGFTPDDTVGNLTLRYKLVKTINGTKYESDEKTALISNFLTKAEANQKLVNDTTAVFTKKATLSANDWASSVTAENWKTKLDATLSNADATLEVRSVATNDETGTVALTYVTTKEGITSYLKYATVLDWNTYQKQVDSTNLTFTNKPVAASTLVSEITADNYATYLTVGNTTADLEISDVRITNKDLRAGTFTLEYKVKRANTTIKSGGYKYAQITNFQTLKQKLDATNWSLEGKAAKNTVLASSVNSSNWETYITKTDLAEPTFKIVNLKFEPNNSTGDLVVKYQITKNGYEDVESVEKSITINGFLTDTAAKQKLVNDGVATFTKKDITPNKTKASQVKTTGSPSTYSQWILETAPLTTQVVIESLSANDSTGVLTINYKLSIDAIQSAEVKTATVNDWYSNANKLEDKANQLAFANKPIASSTKPSTVTAQNYTDYLNVLNLAEGDTLTDVTISEVNDATGKFKLNYKLTKDGLSTALKTATISNFLTTSQDNINQANAALNSVSATASQTGSKILASKVVALDQSLFSVSLPSGFVLNQILAVSEQNDQLGTVLVTLNIKKANTNDVSSDYKVLATGFLNNNKDANQTTASWNILPAGLNVLPSTVTTNNITTYLSAAILAGNANNTSNVQANVVSLKPDDVAGKLEIIYNITAGSSEANKATSNNKIAVVSGFSNYAAILQNATANFNNKAAAATTLPSEVNPANYGQTLEVLGLANNQSIKVLGTQNVNDDLGQFELLYAIQQGGVTSGSKTANITNFLTTQQQTNNITITFAGIAGRENILASEINSNNYQNYVSVTGLKPGFELVDLEFEPNNSDGSLLINYKVLKTNTTVKTTKRTSEKISGFKTTATADAQTVAAASVTFTKKSTAVPTTLASTVQAPTAANSNFSENINQSALSNDITLAITNVSGNDQTGEVTITYTLTKGGQTSPAKTATVAGFYTRQNIVDNAFATFTNKPTAATTNPSDVVGSNNTIGGHGTGNIGQTLNVQLPERDPALRLANVQILNPNDNNGTFTISYDITDGVYTSSTKKTQLITGYQTKEQAEAAKLVEVLNNASLGLKASAHNIYATSIENPNNLNPYLQTLNVPEGYSVAVQSVSDANRSDGTLKVTFKVFKDTNKAALSPTKTVTVSGFMTIPEDLKNINVQWNATDLEKAQIVASDLTTDNVQTRLNQLGFSNNILGQNNISVQVISLTPDNQTGQLSSTVDLIVNDRGNTFKVQKTFNTTGFKTTQDLENELKGPLNELKVSFTKKAPDFDIYGSSLINSTLPTQPLTKDLYVFPTTLKDLAVPDFSLVTNGLWKSNGGHAVTIKLQFPNWTPEDWKQLFSYLKSIQTTDPTTFNAWINKIADLVDAGLKAKRDDGISDIRWGFRIYNIRFDAENQTEGNNLWAVGGYGPNTGVFNDVNANQVMNNSWKIESKEAFKKGMIRNLGKYADNYYTTDNNPAKLSPNALATQNQENILAALNVIGLNPSDKAKIEILKAQPDDITGQLNLTYVLKSTNPTVPNLYSEVRKATVNNFLYYVKDLNNGTYKFDPKLAAANVLPSEVTNTGDNPNFDTYVLARNATGVVINDPSFEIVNLSGNNATGALTINYKLTKTVNNVTYKSDTKQAVLVGFKTTTLTDQEFVDQAQANFTKKATTPRTDFASVVITGPTGNFDTKIETTPLDQATVNVSSVVPNNQTGMLTVNYTITKNNVTSTSKTALVPGWYTYQNQVDEVLATFTNKNPAATNTLPSVLTSDTAAAKGNWETYLGVSNLPENVSIVDLSVINVNDNAGTFDVTYKLKYTQTGENANYTATSGATKLAHITNFKTNQQEVDAVNATFTTKPDAASVLASAVNNTNKATYINETITAGYEIVNLKFEPNDANGQLSIKYQTKKTNQPTLSEIKTAPLLVGFKTQAAVDLEQVNSAVATFTKKPTLAPNTKASAVNKDNFNTKLDTTIPTVENATVNIISTQANDVTGTLSVTYTITKNDQTSNSKTAQVNDWFTNQDETNAIVATFNNTPASRTALPSTITPNNFTNYLNVTGLLTNATLVDVTIENANDNAGTFNIKYKIQYNGLKTEERTANIANFKTNANVAQEELLNALNNTLVIASQTGKPKLSSTVAATDPIDKTDFSFTVPTNYELNEIVAVENANNVLGTVDVTFNIKKAADPTKVSVNSKITVGGFTTNLEDANDIVATWTIKEAGKTVYADFVTTQNFDTYVNQPTFSQNKNANDQVHINVVSVSGTKNQPTLNIVYNVTIGTGANAITSVNKQATVNGFNSITKDLAAATVNFTNKEQAAKTLPSTITPQNYNETLLANIPTGFNLLVSRIEDQNDGAGTFKIWYKLAKNTQLSEEKSADISSFLTAQKYVNDIEAKFNLTKLGSTVLSNVPTVQNLSDYVTTTLESGYELSDVVLTPNVVDGSLGISYKVAKTGLPELKSADPKNATVLGFTTQAADDAKTLATMSTTWSKKEGVAPNTKASAVTKADWSQKIKHADLAAGVNATVVEITSNDNLGTLQVSYTLTKNTTTSQPKTAIIRDWFTNNNAGDSAVAQWTKKPQAATTLPSELHGDVESVLGNYYDALSVEVPAGYAVSEVKILDQNDQAGTLKLKYRLSSTDPAANASALKEQELSGFQTTQQRESQLLNQALEQTKVTVSATGAPKLPSNTTSVAENDQSNFIFNVPTGYEIVLNLATLTNRNDFAGSLEISFKVQKTNTSVQSSLRKVSVAGFLTTQLYLQRLTASWTINPTGAAKLASSVSLENFNTTVSEPTINNNTANADGISPTIKSLVPNDVDGSLTLTYTLTRAVTPTNPTQVVSESKTVKVSGYLTNAKEKENEANRLNQLLNARTGAAIKLTGEAKKIYASSLFANNDLNGVLEGVQIEPALTQQDQAKVVITKASANNETGELKISYKLVSTKPKLEDVESSATKDDVTISGWFTYQQDIDAASSTWQLLPAAAIVKADPNITAANIQDYLGTAEFSSLKQVEGASYEIVSVEKQNNEAGSVELTYKMKLTANGKNYVAAAPKKTVLTGFLTNDNKDLQTLINSNAHYFKKADKLPSEITLENFATYIGHETPPEMTATLKTISEPNDDAGTLKITYDLIKGTQKLEKTAVVKNLFTKQQKVDEVEATFTNKPIAQTTVINLVNDNNWSEYINADIPTGYEIVDVSIIEDSRKPEKGTFSLQYKLKNVAYNLKSSAFKKAAIVGFKTNEESLTNQVHNEVQINPSLQGSTKLPSQLDKAVLSDFSFNVSQGYEIDSILELSNANDFAGTIDIKYKIRLISDPAVVSTKDDLIKTVSGFKTNQLVLNNLLSKLEIKANKKATSLPSNVTNNNWQDYLELKLENYAPLSKNDISLFDLEIVKRDNALGTVETRFKLRYTKDNKTIETAFINQTTEGFKVLKVGLDLPQETFISSSPNNENDLLAPKEQTISYTLNDSTPLSKTSALEFKLSDLFAKNIINESMLGIYSEQEILENATLEKNGASGTVEITLVLPPKPNQGLAQTTLKLIVKNFFNYTSEFDNKNNNVQAVLDESKLTTKEWNALKNDESKHKELAKILAKINFNLMPQNLTATTKSVEDNSTTTLLAETNSKNNIMQVNDYIFDLSKIEIQNGLFIFKPDSVKTTKWYENGVLKDKGHLSLNRTLEYIVPHVEPTLNTPTIAGIGLGSGFALLALLLLLLLLIRKSRKGMWVKV